MAEPSFSSLPPSFGSFPDLEAGPSSRSDNTQKQTERSATAKVRDGKSRRTGDAEDKGVKKYRRQEGSASPERASSRDSRIRSSLSADDKHAGDGGRNAAHHSRDDNIFKSRLYYSDRKGDQLNVTYEGLHAGDVPRYHLVNHDRKILGLEGEWTVLFRGGKAVEVGISGTRKSPQLTDSKTRAILISGGVRRLMPSSKSAMKYEEVDGYIRLPSRRGRPDEQTYRSITAGNDEGSNSDSDSSSSGSNSGSDDDSDTTPLTAREESLRELEQRLQKQPSLIAGWLALVDHSLSNIPVTSKNSDNARAEIAVSILSRALASHPDNSQSAIMRLKYLKFGESIWHESKLRSEWEEALRQTKDADIWMEWLDWRMRKCVNGIDAALQDATRAMRDVAEGLPEEGVEVNRLRVLWRVSIFFMQAGFTERAIALFQAQAELAFNPPDSIRGLPLTQQLDALEEFWEAEEPRTGEANSTGWRNWSPSSDLFQHDSLLVRSKSSHVTGQDPYTRWASTERDGDLRYLLPLRSSNEEDSDPYATIIFSDIRPFLFPLSTRKGRETFRLIWLSLLGLRIPGFVQSLSALSVDSKWADVQFSSPSFLSALLPAKQSAHLIMTDSLNGTLIGKEKSYRNSFGVVKEWGLDTMDLLEGVFVDGSVRCWEVFSGDTELVRCVLRQLRMDNDKQWDKITLAFEAAINIKTALKMSRTLLSSDQNSTVLWAAHARLERIRGRYDDARKVYQTILSSLKPNSGGDASHIWWDLAEMEWLLSRTDAALEVVMRAGGQSGPAGGVAVLRAKRHLEDLARQTSDSNWRDKIRCLRLRILLELLSNGVPAAVTIAEAQLSQTKEYTTMHEALAISSLLLVYHHTVTLGNAAPPAILRGQVQAAIQRYPANSIVLGVFLECEKGEGIWGRVRALLSEDTAGSQIQKNLVRRVSEIWVAGWETGRWDGEIERTRSRLEAAVASDKTKGSSILWRIFIEFEIRFGTSKRAKSALYRALGDCPLVKELYLLAFGPLRSAFSVRELNSFADTMAERGLRLRDSLDDLLADLPVKNAANSDGTGNSDGDDDDELERDSKELRRLMPFH